jgi:hypothetical protein
MPTRKKFGRNGYRPSYGVSVGWKALRVLGPGQVGEVRLVPFEPEGVWESS